MRVHDFSIFSDRCMISTKIELSYDICNGYKDLDVGLICEGSMMYASDGCVWLGISNAN